MCVDSSSTISAMKCSPMGYSYLTGPRYTRYRASTQFSRSLTGIFVSLNLCMDFPSPTVLHWNCKGKSVNKPACFLYVIPWFSCSARITPCKVSSANLTIFSYINVVLVITVTMLQNINSHHVQADLLTIHALPVERNKPINRLS